MPGFCAYPRALPHSHRTLRISRVALIVVASLAVLSGCATSGPRSSSTIQPEPTGNPEMDQMLAMLQQLDEMEDDSIDLAALAATASPQTLAQVTDPSSVATDLTETQQAESSTPREQPIDVPVPATIEADASPADLYARPFGASGGPLDDLDSFEVQLARFNAPPGLLSRNGDRSSDLSESDQDDKHDQVQLALRFVNEIRDRGGQGEPFATALMIAALSPLVGLAPELDLSLTSEATEITDALYELLIDLSSLGSDPDPDEAAAIARAFSDLMGGNRPLEITAAVLCSRVEGFGRYHQLGDTPPKFLSGRESRTVVYVEVDYFSHARVTSSYRGPDQDQTEQWQVRLSQEINLYRANETVPVWTLPASNLSDISRNRRRDFHVTNEIKLPATLALGMYKLKITMRDLVSGAVAEEMIAIQIVNDASLLSSN